MRTHSNSRSRVLRRFEACFSSMARRCDFCSSILAWDTLIRARAIENQCYAIGVNRAGADDFGFYPGHSAIITPYGETLIQTDEKPQMLCAELDMEQLARFRAKFPVLQDADKNER